PNCGSRTTDVELASYAGRCIGCRQLSSVLPLTTPRVTEPAAPDVRWQSGPPEPERRGAEIVGAISSVPSEQPGAPAAPKASDLSPRQGLDPESPPVDLVRHYQQLEDEARNHAANKNMIFGALWCFGGLIVTVFTFAAASGRGGGTYVVAWGAIIF